MKPSESKKIALKIVAAWKSKDRARRRHEYRMLGTATGRVASFRGSMMEVNGVLTRDLSNHPEVVALRRELDAAWPPDMLVSREQHGAILGALQAYAVEHRGSITVSSQQSVLTEGNE